MKYYVMEGFCKREAEKATFKVFNIRLALELDLFIRYIVGTDFIFPKSK